MTTPSVAPPRAQASLRRSGDALPLASIGVSPLVWTNTDRGPVADAATILDEAARTGYEGVQFGAGFPLGVVLRDELARRGLRLAEVYLPIPATVDGPAPDAMHVVLQRLRILDEAGGDVLCAAIDGTADRDRHAGRAERSGVPAFTDAGWRSLADLLHETADAARRLGHPLVFHPHAATLVETPREIDRLLGVTDPRRVGLCLDLGHHAVGGGDPLEAARTYADRIRHVHLKDVDGAILERMRDGMYASLLDAVWDGLFVELGAGMLDLDGVLAALDARAYDGWLLVEQDYGSLPPSESAAIGRRVLDASLRRIARGERRDR